MKVSICIITLYRTEGLTRLLNGLEELEFKKSPEPEIEVIVVDNDINRSAFEVCKVFKKKSNLDIKYLVEPERGIPFARNRAITEADKKSSFIVFIDDDEVPTDKWLDELLFAQKKYNNADIVSGPVIPFFPDSIPDWITNGGFFNRKLHPTGTTGVSQSTANLLIKKSVFESFGKPFSKKFALTGGGDADFLIRARQKGYKDVWSNEAEVYEWIPKNRANFPYLIKRAFRIGANQKTTAQPLLKVYLLILFYLFPGLFYLLGASAGSKINLVKSLKSFSSMLGVIWGLMGFKYDVYKDIYPV